MIVPVSSVQELMPGIFLMWLTAPELADGVKAGQFFMVGCGEDTVLRRPLSVHRVEGGNIALLFALRGKGTAWLAQRKRRQKLDIFGPMGNAFEIAPAAKNLLVVAGGIGIAPLFYLADYAMGTGCKVTMLLGAATKKQLYPANLLPHDIEVVSVTEDGSEGHKGMVTDLIPEYSALADQVFACGPLPMYRHMAAERKALGIESKPVQISLEMRMGCGVGVCYGCTVRTKHGLKQVCRDGPVFALDEVIWDELARR
jgi:dihydroorotate dehydrogenase electron transfer subunit